MTYLRVDLVVHFPSEHGTNSAHVAVIEARHEHRVEAVKVTRKIPETCFPRVTTVDEHIEAVDAEKCRISLSAREHVQCRM